MAQQRQLWAVSREPATGDCHYSAVSRGHIDAGDYLWGARRGGYRVNRWAAADSTARSYTDIYHIGDDDLSGRTRLVRDGLAGCGRPANDEPAIVRIPRPGGTVDTNNRVGD